MRNKVSEVLSGLRDVRDSHVKLERVLQSGPATYYFDKINDYIDGLFSLSKFKVGDHVCLAQDIDCNDAPGWVWAAHFLKKGATARVSDVDFHKGGFQYGIVFDHETWIDLKGKPQPVREKHEFWFREARLEKSSVSSRAD